MNSLDGFDSLPCIIPILGFFLNVKKSINNNINGMCNLSILNKEIIKKLKKIKILLTDVDCVLTDCGMYYDKSGDVMKKFHTRDGMGVTLLRKNNIPTIIVTKEKTPMVKQWAQKMKIFKIFDGMQEKEKILEKICKMLDVESSQVAYIGDDVNDIGLLKKVGFSAVPNDAISDAKKNSDYVCKAEGGNGVLREIVDMILTTQGLNVNFSK